MKILNFGSCNIDFVYSVEQIVVPGETITTKGMEVFPGGKGLNQSIAIARAGASVYHAGCIGQDGVWLGELLAENGVDISYLKKLDAKNGHAVIQVSETGENSIFLYPGSNRMLTVEFIKEVLLSFSKGDILVLQNEVNLVDEMIRLAYEKGMQILLNPAPFTQELKRIDFNMISYLVLNEVEAKCFTGTEDAEESIAYLLEHYPDMRVILTLGKKGCIYADRDQVMSYPAFCVDAVDTTAAGDTFTGYFIAMLAQGKSVREAIGLATAASALAVSKMGAATSIPTKSEVEKAMFDLKPYEVEKKSREAQISEKIDRYLSIHLQDANMDGLAEALGYTKVYAGELVKKVTNESFSALLQKKRCACAAGLLCETDLSVTDIINRVGYENESFFRKVFKEMYGENPLQYRKKRGAGRK